MATSHGLKRFFILREGENLQETPGVAIRCLARVWYPSLCLALDICDCGFAVIDFTFPGSSNGSCVSGCSRMDVTSFPIDWCFQKT